jgi:uncharacterized protein
MRLNAGGLSSLLIGRLKEKQTLKAYISMGQHIAIIAPRRYGKTTLVNAILNEIKDEYLVVKVDVFSAGSVREFCHLFIDAVYHSKGITGFLKEAKDNVLDMLSRFSVEIEDIKPGFDLLKETDENELVRKSLDFAEEFAIRHNVKAVVFFDEFGDLTRFGNDFVKKLRSHFQTHNNVSYIFAGSQQSVMNGIFLNKDNAFFNFASLMELGVLDTVDVGQFLDGLCIGEFDFTDNAKKEIVQTSKNHPFYLIKLVQESYIMAILNDKKNIDSICVQEAISKILSDNNAFFEGEWRMINSKKHKGLIFKELCGVVINEKLEETGASYKSQMIKELASQSIINRDKKPTDPFLELWVNQYIL